MTINQLSYQSVFTILLLIGALAAPLHSWAEEPQPLEWEDLMPEGFSEDELFASYNPDNYEDGDPEGQRLYEEFMLKLEAAPVVEELSGKLVSLPGFAVPLEGDDESVQEFLLVPYFGACIHVPPPPSNQMVLVRADPGVAINGLFAPVKVSGRILIERTSTALASTSYTLDLTNIQELQNF